MYASSSLCPLFGLSVEINNFRNRSASPERPSNAPLHNPSRAVCLSNAFMFNQFRTPVHHRSALDSFPSSSLRTTFVTAEGCYSVLPSPLSTFNLRLSTSKFFICHRSEKSPVSLIIATDPKMRPCKSFVCHTCETPPPMPSTPHESSNVDCSERNSASLCTLSVSALSFAERFSALSRTVGCELLPVDLSGAVRPRRRKELALGRVPGRDAGR